jgi:FlaG/FlaF family flagellin (archaellin)
MGALIPLAISLAPEIAKWLFGARGEQTAAAVAQVVQSVTGTTDDAVAQQVIARDPAAAASLRLQLAQLAAQQEQAARQAELDELTGRLRDVQDARAQTVSLARTGSAVQWAPAIVSFVVLATFGIVMWAALSHALPAGSETILNMLLGTLAAMATSVVGYWVGSSAGSAQKNDLLYRSNPNASESKP